MQKLRKKLRSITHFQYGFGLATVCFFLAGIIALYLGQWFRATIQITVAVILTIIIVLLARGDARDNTYTDY